MNKGEIIFSTAWTTPARYSIVNVTREDLQALKRASFAEDDIMQAGLCVIALEGTFDAAFWTTTVGVGVGVTRLEAKILENVSQLDALRMCVSVLNDNERQKEHA